MLLGGGAEETVYSLEITKVTGGKMTDRIRLLSSSVCDM